MSEPLVSGITIFYNAERFIEEAILSVLSQAEKRWELLLVDDGSTDQSTVIARRYASKYPERIFYLEHPGHQNGGMSASRNLGIRHARGRYIAFLDADDVWLPEKLSRQVQIMEENSGLGMVCGPTLFWNTWRKDSEHVEDVPRNIGIPPHKLFEPLALLPLFIRDKVKTPATCSVLIRKEVFNLAGGFEETFRGMYEDQAFFSKVYLHSTVYSTEDCWDKYRQHPQSCCAVAQQQSHYDPKNPNPAHQRFLEWMRNYLLEENVTNPAVWEAINEALWPYNHPLQYRAKRFAKNLVYRPRSAVKRRLRRLNSLYSRIQEARAAR